MLRQCRDPSRSCESFTRSQRDLQALSKTPSANKDSMGTMPACSIYEIFNAESKEVNNLVSLVIARQCA